jgi:hypothetical protein
MKGPYRVWGDRGTHRLLDIEGWEGDLSNMNLYLGDALPPCNLPFVAPIAFLTTERRRFKVLMWRITDEVRTIGSVRLVGPAAVPGSSRWNIGNLETTAHQVCSPDVPDHQLCLSQHSFYCWISVIYKDSTVSTYLLPI